MSRAKTSPHAHRRRNVILGTGLLMALVLFFYWRAEAPVHGVRDAAACELAYAAATNRADSLSIDFMSYAARRGLNERCGMLHPTPMNLGQR